MYRAALRSPPNALRAVRPATLTSGARRLLTTASTAKKGTWKGAGLRWGLAIATVYFYNTSPIFADELPPQAGPAPSPFSDADMPTVDALIEEKRRHASVTAPSPRRTAEAPRENTQAASETEAAATPAAVGGIPDPGSAEALEQEAASEGAFNPETGEINWDCPCLGGMADGPCGEQFKAAFSCFVYSTEEPKGMDCIEKFQGMQDCFRLYPDIYGAEIADDEREDSPVQELDGAAAKEVAELAAPANEDSPKSGLNARDAKSSAPVADVVQDQAQELREEVKAKVEGAVPAESHDATVAKKDEDK